MTSNHNSWLPYPCFCVSQVANSIRVIKTKKQTSSENCSYISAAQEIIEKDLLDGIIFGETARMWKILSRHQCFSCRFQHVKRWPHYWADGGMGIRVFQKKILKKVKLKSFLPSYYWHPTKCCRMVLPASSFVDWAHESLGANSG